MSHTHDAAVIDHVPLTQPWSTHVEKENVSKHPWLRAQLLAHVDVQLAPKWPTGQSHDTPLNTNGSEHWYTVTVIIVDWNVVSTGNPTLAKAVAIVDVLLAIDAKNWVPMAVAVDASVMLLIVNCTYNVVDDNIRRLAPLKLNGVVLYPVILTWDAVTLGNPAAIAACNWRVTIVWFTVPVNTEAASVASAVNLIWLVNVLVVIGVTVGNTVAEVVVGATVVGADVVAVTVVGAVVVGAAVVGAIVVGATVVGAAVVGGCVVGASVGAWQ
jgi:hypothetical protein